jgi:hypothetical protein
MNDSSSNNLDITSIDMATLTFLTNVNCRAKLETLEGLHNLKNNHKAKLKQDIKFYRKRIMSGVKDILLRKKNSVITDKTKSAFDVFVASLIDDFKVDDTNDVIQANLNDIDSTVSDENESNESNEFNINSELRENYKNQSNQANQSNQENHNYKIINQANELLKKTKVSNPTMDKFVIKKQLDERYAVATPQSKMFDTPPPNTIDLREPSLRTKGIRKSSKENVNKEYENRQDDSRSKKENKTKNTKKK